MRTKDEEGLRDADFCLHVALPLSCDTSAVHKTFTRSGWSEFQGGSHRQEAELRSYSRANGQGERESCASVGLWPLVGCLDSGR